MTPPPGVFLVWSILTSRAICTRLQYGALVPPCIRCVLMRRRDSSPLFRTSLAISVHAVPTSRSPRRPDFIGASQSRERWGQSPQAPIIGRGRGRAPPLRSDPPHLVIANPDSSGWSHLTTPAGPQRSPRRPDVIGAPRDDRSLGASPPGPRSTRAGTGPAPTITHTPPGHCEPRFIGVKQSHNAYGRTEIATSPRLHRYSE